MLSSNLYKKNQGFKIPLAYKHLVIFFKFCIYFLIFNIYYSSCSAKTLMVFAPSSLREALEENIIEFGKNNNIKVKGVYLGTSSLALQIKNGAKPDLFISANKYWMDYLESKNIILKKYRIDYLFNDLVLITHNENASNYKNLSLTNIRNMLLGSKKRISLAMVDSVPAGIYAKNILLKMKVWNDLKNNLAQSSNVRIALNLVAMKELDFGFVYKSDTFNNRKIAVLYNFNNFISEQIVYPLTVLNEDLDTLAFYNYLKSKASKNIMSKWGFKLEKYD